MLIHAQCDRMACTAGDSRKTWSAAHCNQLALHQKPVSHAGKKYDLAPLPAIIFADEPTGNLDTATGHSIIELIFARRAALGATLLIITHDPELAEHCDRVITMHDGRIEERAA